MKIEKVMKKLPPGFADEAGGMDEEQLRGTIVDADTVTRETEMTRDADDRLAAAKENVKDLSSGYRDVITAQRAKVSYCLHLLEERGKLGVTSRKSSKKKS